MPLPHRNSATGPGPPTGRVGSARRALLTGGLVAASLMLTACGSSGSPSTASSPTLLNTSKIAGAIEQSSLAQRGEHARVTCPSRVLQQQGLVFACTALVAHSSTRFVVTELNGAGDVHYVAP